MVTFQNVFYLFSTIFHILELNMENDEWIMMEL